MLSFETLGLWQSCRRLGHHRCFGAQYFGLSGSLVVMLTFRLSLLFGRCRICWPSVFDCRCCFAGIVVWTLPSLLVVGLRTSCHFGESSFGPSSSSITFLTRCLKHDNLTPLIVHRLAFPTRYFKHDSWTTLAIRWLAFPTRCLKHDSLTPLIVRRLVSKRDALSTTVRHRLLSVVSLSWSGVNEWMAPYIYKPWGGGNFASLCSVIIYVCCWASPMNSFRLVCHWIFCYFMLALLGSNLGLKACDLHCIILKFPRKIR